MLARRSPQLAALAIAAAILIKARVLLPAALAVRAVRGSWRQLATLAGGIAVAIAVTWAVGRAAYVHALRVDAQAHQTLYGVLHYAFFVAAIVVTALAVRGIVVPFGEWTYPWAAAWLYSWYLDWALSYALLRRNAMVDSCARYP